MLARHRIGVLRDTAMTINDGGNEFINGEHNGKRKGNTSKPTGPKEEARDYLSCKRCITTKENARM